MLPNDNPAKVAKKTINIDFNSWYIISKYNLNR